MVNLIGPSYSHRLGLWKPGGEPLDFPMVSLPPYFYILCVVFLYKYLVSPIASFSLGFLWFFSMKSVFFLGLFGMKE